MPKFIFSKLWSQCLGPYGPSCSKVKSHFKKKTPVSLQGWLPLNLCLRSVIFDIFREM